MFNVQSSRFKVLTKNQKPVKNMPKKLEEKLKKEGRAKGYKGERLNAYVYGTLRQTGWKPSREKGAVKILRG